MCTKILLVNLLCMLHGCVEAASYDQSQSGGMNVQVDLKGLQIIALMKGGKEEYVDYDYAYDYSEMTIKPQNGTTPKPLNVTTSESGQKQNITTASPADAALSLNSTALSLNSTALLSSTLSPNSSESAVALTEPETTTTLSSSTTTDVPHTQNISSSTAPETTTLSSGCKKGFAVNQKGDCELKMPNAGTNALLKLVKLSQKLKLRREKGHNVTRTTV